MRHYSVPLIGSGVSDATIDDPITASVPVTQPAQRWTGHPHTDNTYLVAVPDDQPIPPGPGVQPIPDGLLNAEAIRRGHTPGNVRSWFVQSPNAQPPGQSAGPPAGQSTGRDR
jgi:hypothetical protein